MFISKTHLQRVTVLVIFAYSCVARVFRIRSISRLSVVSFAIAKLRNHLEMVRPL